MKGLNQVLYRDFWSPSPQTPAAAFRRINQTRAAHFLSFGEVSACAINHACLQVDEFVLTQLALVG